MAENKKRADGKRKGRKTLLLIVLLLLLLLLILLGVLLFRSPQFSHMREAIAGAFGLRRAAPIRPDTTASAETAVDTGAALQDTTAPRDSALAADTSGRGAAPKTRRRASAPPVLVAPAVDTASPETRPVEPAPCEIDTVPPWIYPDPSGGLHRRHVAVRLLSVEHCTIEWRFAGEKEWHPFTGEPILVTRDTTLQFTARDTCGNVLPPRTEIYTITRPLAFRRCPDDMEFIKVGDTEFCVDRYEWPNRRETRPIAYVSIYEARDSCFTAGKRLCSTDEWMLACGGAFGWQYPYGAVYEPHACNTEDTTVCASGTRVECRGYFDVYDMSGNLAEWTNTPSPRNRQFYNVMGGFWESGPQAGCFEKRHSYFPRNRHNPVGFRCCSDAEAPAGDAGRKQTGTGAGKTR